MKRLLAMISLIVFAGVLTACASLRRPSPTPPTSPTTENWAAQRTNVR